MAEKKIHREDYNSEKLVLPDSMKSNRDREQPCWMLITYMLNIRKGRR